MILLQLSQILDSTNHLRSVAVLIVIPANNLYLISIVINLANHSLSCIEQRTVLHTNDIRRNDLILVVTEALSNSSLHSLVDTLYSYTSLLNYSDKNSSRSAA